MKRTGLFITLMFMLTACTKILHKENFSIGRIENYDQLLSAVNDVYGKLDKVFYSNFNDFIPSTLYITKGDDLNDVTPDYGYLAFGDCPNSPAMEYPNAGPSWSYLYDVIGQANNILVQYNLSKTSNIATRQLLGEVYLIRAYCYFRLTRSFGEIPLIDNIDINYSVKKASFKEIYAFIENDLETAMNLLPAKNSLARIPDVTPNKGTVKAILAEVYLSWAGYPIKDNSKYALAAREAGDLIDSAGYFGYKLLDDFAWLWDKAHLYNSESVFSLYCSNTLNPDQNQPWTYVFYPHDFWATETKFFNDYPRGYRKDITFQTNILDYFHIHEDPTINIDSANIRIDTITSCTWLSYRKFYYYHKMITDNIGSLHPVGLPRVYILRYAQTVLTYAEAAARSGQLNDKAYECVNEIRRRAHHLDLYTPSPYDLQPGLSPQVFADSVVWERAWELAGEPEGRWFDLVRLEEVEDLPKLRDPNEVGWPSYTPSKKDYFSPIPESEVNFDPNLGK